MPALPSKTPNPWDPREHDTNLIWVDVPEGKLENSNALMAGYLGLADTKQLKELIREPLISALLATFEEYRDRYFDLEGNRKERVNRSRVTMSAVMKDVRNAKYQPYLTAAAPIKSVGGCLPNMVPLVSWMNIIHQIVLTKPSLFPVTPDGVIPLESYHQAYWLVRWAKKVSRPGRKVVDEKNERSKPAIIPNYAHPDQRARVRQPRRPDIPPPMGRDNQQETDNLLLKLGLVQPAHNSDHDVSPVDNKSTFFDDLCQTVESDYSLNDGLCDRHRAPLSAELRLKLLLKFGSEVTVLGGKGPVEGDDSLARCRQEAIVAAQAASPFIPDDPQEDALGSSGRLPPSGNSAKQEQKFWRLQQRLNVEQSRPPDYLEACKLLAIDPASPMIPLPKVITTLKPPSEPPSVLLLKPWQVVGIAWMILQEESPIKGGVIGDDCGLGKTIQTLAFIVFSALRLPPGYSNHQPTIIQLPPSIIDTWLLESSRHFINTLDVILCHRMLGGDLVRRGLFVGPDNLLPRLRALDPAKITTSLTVVIVSYNSFPPYARTTLSAIECSAEENLLLRKVCFHFTVSPILPAQSTILLYHLAPCHLLPSMPMGMCLVGISTPMGTCLVGISTPMGMKYAVTIRICSRSSPTGIEHLIISPPLALAIDRC